MRNGRAVLFFSVIGIFVATALVTLLGVIGAIEIEDRFLNPLFAALVIELVGAVVGLFKATDWFGSTRDSRDIEGGWWQLVSVSDDANVLAFIDIAYSPEQQQLEIRGKAFTAQGEPHSGFWSESASLNASTFECHYFWKGDREGTNANFSGVGYILFESPPEGGKPASAVGWFITGDLDQQLITARRKVKYWRASDADALTMRRPEDVKAWSALAASVHARTQVARA